MTEDVRAKNEEKWRIATNKIIALQQVSNIEKLLDGKASHYVCVDKFTTHEKIVIEYNHKKK